MALKPPPVADLLRREIIEAKKRDRPLSVIGILPHHFDAFKQEFPFQIPGPTTFMGVRIVPAPTPFRE